VRGPRCRARIRDAPARRADSGAAALFGSKRRRDGPRTARAVGRADRVRAVRDVDLDDDGGRAPRRARRGRVDPPPRIARPRAAGRADVDVRDDPDRTVRLHGDGIRQAAPFRLCRALPSAPRGDSRDGGDAVRAATHPLHGGDRRPFRDADLSPRRAGHLAAFADDSRPQHRPHLRIHRVRARGAVRRAAALRSAQRMTGERSFTLVLVEMALLVLLGPLVTGAIQKLKARLQSRQGAGILQPYRDLAKLFRKSTVQADTASGFFRAIPVLVLAATVAAGALVPVVRAGTPAVPMGDALMLLGLLALARFLPAVGAL